MDLIELILHIELFHKEFQIDTTPEARADKLFDEVNEFATALAHETKAQADDEAVDVLVCAISNVVSRGIINPLDACFFKLQRTAEKYRKRARIK
jgi:NTP pyrophosphatase (non-canonical NTP hydrolase)